MSGCLDEDENEKKLGFVNKKYLHSSLANFQLSLIHICIIREGRGAVKRKQLNFTYYFLRSRIAFLLCIVHKLLLHNPFHSIPFPVRSFYFHFLLILFQFQFHVGLFSLSPVNSRKLNLRSWNYGTLELRSLVVELGWNGSKYNSTRT